MRGPASAARRTHNSNTRRRALDGRRRRPATRFNDKDNKLKTPPHTPRSQQIQFGLLSPEEIVQTSELQVYERALYTARAPCFFHASFGFFMCVVCVCVRARAHVHVRVYV